MNFKSFIDWNYYFSSSPASGNFKFLIPLLIVFGLLLLVGIFFKYSLSLRERDKKYNKLLGDKIFSSLLNIFIAGYAYLFFRYEGIRFLSSRFWLVLIVIWFIWSGYQLWIFYSNDYQKMKKSFESRSQTKIYKPKRKKRK